MVMWFDIAREEIRKIMTDVTKFIDKETGEIHIGEVVIGPNTRWDDIERLAPYAEISGNENIKILKFSEKLTAGNIPVGVKLTLFVGERGERSGPGITLLCEPTEEYDDPTKEWNYIWLAAGKVWLKAVLGEPDWEDDEAIGYQYAWGRISICVARDIRSDLRGGEIFVNYGRK